jgi:NAD(P)-dependent dehydrogenase (short-subunit alcohol dehydrogenase family)
MCFVGCDSGFGHELAKGLDKLGVTVFAGCLFPESAGATELKAVCSDRLHILHLDVTKKEHVQNVVETVRNSLGVRSKYGFKVNGNKICTQKVNICHILKQKLNYIIVSPCVF